MQKLSRRRQRQHPGGKNLSSYLSARAVVDAHLINGENGAQVGVCSSSFLISSVSSFQFSRPTTVILFGGELDCAGSGEPILFPCVCVRLHVCVCAGERERERLCMCGDGTSERRPARVCCSSPIQSLSNPARLPHRLRSERCATIGWFSHQSTLISARTRLLNITPPSPSLPSLSLSTSPHYPSLSLLTHDYVR